MIRIVEIAIHEWSAADVPGDAREQALQDLEAGAVLYFPRLPCPVDRIQPFLLADDVGGKGKNVTFDGANGMLRGVRLSAALHQNLKDAMRDYSSLACAFVRSLFPRYRDALQTGRTSFRPVEVATRRTSWRKDDTRLHVDSFPATPVEGKRILRIFSNVNPDGDPRSWRVGEPFDDVVRRFLPGIRAPLPGSAALLHLLGATKTRRSDYDHYMLRLHDAMKRDRTYQTQVQRTAIDFPAGSTWLIYTDQVSHAAMAGRCAFEQTFYLPVHAMADEAKSPLRTLERALHRSLV